MVVSTFYILLYPTQLIIGTGPIICWGAKDGFLVNILVVVTKLGRQFVNL